MGDLIIELEKLIEAGQTDDAQIVEGLVEGFYADLYHLAITILGDADEAEDAAQETLIIAVTKLDQYQPHTNLKAWLYTIAVNICRGYLRKRKRRLAFQKVLQTFWPSETAPPTPEEVAMQNEMGRQLWKAVNTLGEKHRLPILLRYLHTLSIHEIAQILGINEGTVRSRLHYGVQQLQGQLLRSNFRFTKNRKTYL